MSRSTRVVFLVVAVAIAVVAAIAIGSGGDDEQAAATTGSQAVTAGATTGSAEVAPKTTTTTTPAPKPPLLTASGPRTLTFQKGGQIRFRARSETADEVHVHGYDLEYELKPGVVRTVSFPATIEGIFEVELHATGTPIGKLRVEP
ncbi:MAG: hypothetical protein V9E83_01885, partial [Baekduia sp.]